MCGTKVLLNPLAKQARLNCRPEPLLKYTSTQQYHQHLIVCDSGSLIHGVKTVQDAHYFLLIEKGQRRKKGTAKRILHKHAESALRVERRRWTKECVFGATINSFCNYIARRFS